MSHFLLGLLLGVSLGSWLFASARCRECSRLMEADRLKAKPPSPPICTRDPKVPLKVSVSPGCIPFIDLAARN